MISKNDIKYLRSLQLKKFRDKERQFAAEGKNNVEEGIKSSYKCTHLVVTEKYLQTDPEILEIAKRKNIRYSITSEEEFVKASESVSPQGVLAVFDYPEVKNINFNDLDETVVYLDEISDPGNVGTILRTCDWFGISHVILSKNSADIFNPKTVRASAGSVFHLNLYPDIYLSGIADDLKKAGYIIAASVLDGESLYSSRIGSKSVVVFSNEAVGISADILKAADKKITIPRYGKAESLNVASAAAVILAEIVGKGKH
jgi:RNA methyltransferase, TrmH family